MQKMLSSPFGYIHAYHTLTERAPFCSYHSIYCGTSLIWMPLGWKKMFIGRFPDISYANRVLETAKCVLMEVS